VTQVGCWVGHGHACPAAVRNRAMASS
jgi:hypothetical protein